MATTRDPNNLPQHPGFEDEDYDITPRDSSILHAILGEGLTVFTFDGVKRLLGIHQEVLSRVLDRLEDQGLVEKVAQGYRVTTKGEEIVARPLSSSPHPIPIIQSLLPRDVETDRIVSSLMGRWFGNLRWLGYSRTEDGVVLKWITDDEGIQVDAKFTDSILNIEAKVGEGKEADHAVKASYQLLSHIARLYTVPRRTRNLLAPVAYFPSIDFA